ncbi:MAG: RecX family transcriptional regulator [Odoribacter sp.]|nr:RecX family transcriptional regulator [Odoribacter sp.]
MTTENALRIITGLCSRKEYCTADILEKLRKWEITDEDSRKIMDFLYQYKFVDDARFARIYVEDKFRFNRWGKQKIVMMLRRKNIPSEIIEEALRTADIRDYQEQCRELLEQKRKALNETDYYKLKAKLIRFGAGRGFDLETVYACLRQMFPAD